MKWLDKIGKQIDDEALAYTAGITLAVGFLFILHKLGVF